MATRNLSEFDSSSLHDVSALRFDIVVSRWNEQVTDKLLEGAVECLKSQGVPQEQIRVFPVPGSFELVYAAARLMKGGPATRPADAIIALGCVVRGGTPHFDYVCQGVTRGLSELNARGEVPVIFGLLTTDDMQQSLDRAGGIYGNKGVEAAYTAMEMAQLSRQL